MVNQYAGAPDSKMKNCAIWSKTVVEDAGMMVSTAQFWHRCSSGCKECAPLDCAEEAVLLHRRGVSIYRAAIQMNWLRPLHKFFSALHFGGG